MWFRRRDKQPKDESQKALDEAQSKVREIQDRAGEISELADAFKEFRERNHFAEQMEDILYRRRRET